MPEPFRETYSVLWGALVAAIYLAMGAAWAYIAATRLSARPGYFLSWAGGWSLLMYGVGKLCAPDHPFVALLLAGSALVSVAGAEIGTRVRLIREHRGDMSPQ